MRGTIGLAARAFAAAALAVLVTPAGCSPVQWDFTFVEDFPASDETPPFDEFIVPAGGLSGGFTDTRDLDAQTGVEEGTELYLTSLSFSITPASTEPDFSSIESITISVAPQSGGTPVVIASLGPGTPSLFAGDTINLVPSLVDLADYIGVPYTVTVTITGVGGVGPTTELRFVGQAVFSGTKAL
ncbi:MAG: hypothetical protein ACYTFI_11045 [Planctomycetota bacterium]